MVVELRILSAHVKPISWWNLADYCPTLAEVGPTLANIGLNLATPTMLGRILPKLVRMWKMSAEV